MSAQPPLDLNGQVIALHHEGLSRAKIAQRCGISPTAVLRIQREAGIARVANRTAATLRGETLADPKRADRALRRFSWGA